jgi:hypothetical protein
VWVPESAHAAAVAHRCEHTQEIIMAMILPWSIYKPQILTSEDISPSPWFRRFFHVMDLFLRHASMVR